MTPPNIPKGRKVAKPQSMWAVYNYGRLMAVEHRRAYLANIFCGGALELTTHLEDGSITVFRCMVKPIRRTSMRREK